MEHPLDGDNLPSFFNLPFENLSKGTLTNQLDHFDVLTIRKRRSGFHRAFSIHPGLYILVGIDVAVTFAFRNLLGTIVFLRIFVAVAFIGVEDVLFFFCLFLLLSFEGLSVGHSLDDGSCLGYSFFCGHEFLDSLHFARIVGEAKFICGTGAVSDDILFEDGGAGLHRHLESLGHSLDFGVGRIGLVGFGDNLAINLILLHGRWGTLGPMLGLLMDLRMISPW